MEYIFGAAVRNGMETENLKTIGETHSSLNGFMQTVREYSDSTVTDSFRITGKYRTAEDAQGRCYDWYTIDRHYRYVDKASAVKSELETQLLDGYELLADQEYRLCRIELGA